jgi:hypothetical protein
VHVLCVHHAGKSDREDGDSILGSTAILAAVDTAFILKRSERYRTMMSMQRYGEDLPETVLRFDPTTRTVSLGESREAEEEKRMAEAIVEFLDTKQAPAEESEIQDEVEGRKAVKVRALRRLLEEEKVYRQRKNPDLNNRRGNPYLYTLSLHWFIGSHPSQENVTGSHDSAKNEEPATDEEAALQERYEDEL